MRLTFIVVLLALAASSCKAPKELVKPLEKDTYLDGQMVFIKAEDLTAALDKAMEKNKPLFIEFEADWCLPCKMMSEEVFTHKETADYFNENFVNYKVDVEEGTGPNLKMLFGVNILPCLLYTSPSPRDQRGSRMPSSA